MTSSDDDILAAARDGFIEEAHEMLRQFEAALLVLENQPDDRDNLDAAFRAAHTIKGTAGLFGFDAVVAFTHEVETLMDAVREGERALDAGVAALLLLARDQIERLLEEVASGRPTEEAAQRSVELGQALRAARGEPAGTDATADATNEHTASTASAAPASAAPAGAEALWHISLRFDADALRHGIDPLSFVRYLGTIGEVRAVALHDERVPSLEQLDPESCHLSIEIRLATEASRAEIQAVFDFCADDSDIVILAPQAAPAEYDELLERRSGGDAEARAALLAHWDSMGLVLPRRPEAAPDAPPAIERRAAPVADRRQQEPERRQGVVDRRAGDDTRFIRVRADKLDRLIDLIGELVIASSGAQLVAETEKSAAMTEAAMRIHDLVQEARDGALGLRMVPIGETFARFHRVVRDVSKQLGKTVELQITGGDTELDKSMVETIADPLMHLVRNSLDHGIEAADERSSAGKPSCGRLGLNAYHESGSIVIEVSDDGRGLARERILAKAQERGLVAADAVLDDEAVAQLIFEPGFSTAEQVTNLSGRGVGMDVVKRNIESLRGQIKVATQAGRGTTIQIRLPLTLAIIDGFLTSVGGVSYVLPLELVAECLEVPPECADADARVSGHFDLRGEIVPYVDIGRLYRHTPPKGGRRSMVLVRDGSHCIGLVVDRLHGEHQTVIKPLGRVFQQIRGLAGSTILGSGEVALILDVPALLQLATTACSRGAVTAGARTHS